MVIDLTDILGVILLFFGLFTFVVPFALLAIGSFIFGFRSKKQGTQRAFLFLKTLAIACPVLGLISELLLVRVCFDECGKFNFAQFVVFTLAMICIGFFLMYLGAVFKYLRSKRK